MKILNIIIAALIYTTCLSYSQDILITNVNIIDVEEGFVKKKMNIQIQEGIIKLISDKKIKPNKNSRIIDGKDKYLLPGFIDSHAHVAMGPIEVNFDGEVPELIVKMIDELPQISSQLLLNHGITTARDPGGKTEVTVKTKNNIKEGKFQGPEFFVAGNILDTMTFKNLVTTVSTKEDIELEIQRQYEAGVDYVKLYTSLDSSQTKIAIDEAKRLGIKTVAHLMNTSWTQASNLGVDNIVHITPGSEVYIPEEHLTKYRESARFGAVGFYKWFEYVDLESPEIKELIETLKRNHTSIDPTLIVFHATFFGNTPFYKNNPMIKELPSTFVENWRTTFNFNIGWNQNHFEEAQKTWTKIQQFVKLLHDNGILLTAGTDANNPWIVPGDSFHQELILLKDCGLSNQEVLKIATLNGAKLLNIEDRIGTIEEGKEADLVLLNSNPMEDIQNTRDINHIILDGKLVE